MPAAKRRNGWLNLLGESVIRFSVAPQASAEGPLRHSHKYKVLASRFVKNMKKFADKTPEEVIAAGPKV